jgi:hypothetical protein
LFASGTLLLIVASGAAHAGSAEEKQSTEIWQQQDSCARQAFKKFPDYTAAAIRHRNAAIQACNAALGLPPRDDIGASSVRRIPDPNSE